MGCGWGGDVRVREQSWSGSEKEGEQVRGREGGREGGGREGEGGE